MEKRLLLFFVSIIVFSLFSFSQSTSVFDANYFNISNTAPPIKIGKGFHINDVYKQTRSCFTSETSNSNNLTPQQSIDAAKQNLRLFYTKTNEEYNSFKSQGVSGKVNYLNLFSAGAEKLNEISRTEVLDEERLIFTLNIDFGIWSFEEDPILLPEARDLISQNKLQDFVKMFGTHYISGVRKEAQIKVILTKNSSKYTTENDNYNSLNGGAKIPLKASGSFEINGKNETSEFINNNDFSVSIEIYGPKLDQSDLENSIIEIIDSESVENKEAAIQNLIATVAGNITDPSQSIITQFYYSPFSLYGLDGISWDENKQNELSKLNTYIIEVYQTKVELDEWVNPASAKLLIEEYRIEEEIPFDYQEKLFSKYDLEVLPILKQISFNVDSMLDDLKTRYNDCSNVYCNDTRMCCNNTAFLNELNVFEIDNNIENALSNIFSEVYDEIEANEEVENNKPECEKNEQGIVTFVNLSSNPYNLYFNNDFFTTIEGNDTQSFFVDLGNHRFKAVQKSGYLLYATENIRNAEISSICEELTFKIGFEE